MRLSRRPISYIVFYNNTDTDDLLETDGNIFIRSSTNYPTKSIPNLKRLLLKLHEALIYRPQCIFQNEGGLE